MGRKLLLLGILVLSTACTTVRLVKRDDCWVRQTEQFGAIVEDIGPCTRAPPAWSDDRLTRVVQECVAAADHRWQNAALEAWNRNERLPEKTDERAVLDACVAEATQMLSFENDSLKLRVADVDAQRDRAQTHNEHLANVLGEAAKKPAGSATATASATGEGSSNNRSDSHHAQSELASAPLVLPTPTLQPIVMQAPTSEPLSANASPQADEKPRVRVQKRGAKRVARPAVKQDGAPRTQPGSNPPATPVQQATATEPGQPTTPSACECPPPTPE